MNVARPNSFGHAPSPPIHTIQSKSSIACTTGSIRFAVQRPRFLVLSHRLPHGLPTEIGTTHHMNIRRFLSLGIAQPTRSKLTMSYLFPVKSRRSDNRILEAGKPWPPRASRGCSNVVWRWLRGAGQGAFWRGIPARTMSWTHMNQSTIITERKAAHDYDLVQNQIISRAFGRVYHYISY